MFFFAAIDSNSKYDDECTIGASELLSSTQGEEDMEICITGVSGNFEFVVPYGSETTEEWWNRLIAELKEKFDQINTVGTKNNSAGIEFLLRLTSF